MLSPPLSGGIGIITEFSTNDRCREDRGSGEGQAGEI